MQGRSSLRSHTHRSIPMMPRTCPRMLPAAADAGMIFGCVAWVPGRGRACGCGAEPNGRRSVCHLKASESLPPPEGTKNPKGKRIALRPPPFRLDRFSVHRTSPSALSYVLLAAPFLFQVALGTCTVPPGHPSSTNKYCKDDGAY